MSAFRRNLGDATAKGRSYAARFQRMPWKWTAFQAASLLFVGVVSSWLVYLYASSDESRERYGRGRSLAGIVANAARERDPQEENAVLTRILEGAVRTGDISAGAIVAREGTIIAHTDMSRAGSVTSSKLVVSGSATDATDSPIATELFGSNSGSLFLHPLVGEEGPMGYIALLQRKGGGIGISDLRYFLPTVLLLLAFAGTTRTMLRWAGRPTIDFLDRLTLTLARKEQGDEQPVIEEPEVAMNETVDRVVQLITAKDDLTIENRLLDYEKKRMEQVLDAFPDGLAVTDSIRDVVYMNKSAKHLLAAAAEVADGENGAEKPLLDQLIKEAEQSGHAMLPNPAGGSDKQVMFNRVPLIDPRGRSVGTLFTMRDMSAHNASQRAQAEFLSQVTHELKAPLHTVISFVEELADNDGLSADDRKDYCNTLSSETERMAQLITNLLQLSRIELGNLSSNFRFLKVGTLLRDQAESLRRQAESKNLDFILDIPENIPAIRGDKDLLGVAINNLISNAIKYTKPGGTVKVQGGTADGGNVIEVEDTGIGIAPEDRPHVFERFYRSDSVEVRDQSGSGLGLSLVKEIVETHEGRITLEEKAGPGSCFRIWLPAKEAGSRLDVADALA